MAAAIAGYRDEESWRADGALAREQVLAWDLAAVAGTWYQVLTENLAAGA